jgi:hypothetical protein
MAGPERDLWVLAPWASGAASVRARVGPGWLSGVAGVRSSRAWAGAVGVVGCAGLACAVAVLGSGGLAVSDGFAGVPSRLASVGLADGADGAWSRCASALGGGTVVSGACDDLAGGRWRWPSGGVGGSGTCDGFAGGRWRLPSGGVGGSGISDRVAGDPKRLLSCGWVAWLGLAGVSVRLVFDGLVGIPGRAGSPCAFARGRCGGPGASDGSAGGP